METEEQMREEFYDKKADADLVSIADFWLSKLHLRETELRDFILPKVQKFIDKVESGNARSKETYADMKSIKEYLALPDLKPKE